MKKAIPTALPKEYVLAQHPRRRPQQRQSRNRSRPLLSKRPAHQRFQES